MQKTEIPTIDIEEMRERMVSTFETVAADVVARLGRSGVGIDDIRETAAPCAKIVKEIVTTRLSGIVEVVSSAIATGMPEVAAGIWGFTCSIAAIESAEKIQQIVFTEEQENAKPEGGD